MHGVEYMDGCYEIVVVLCVRGKGWLFKGT